MVKSGREELAIRCIRVGLTRFHENPEFNNLALSVRVTSDTLKTHGQTSNPVCIYFSALGLVSRVARGLMTSTLQ